MNTTLDNVNRCLRIVMLLFSLAALPAMGAEVYVSFTGDDGNPGSSQRPVRSLTRAQQLVREMPGRGREPIVVHLAEGVYYLNAPLVFTTSDSGTESAPITWTGRDRKAVISGGVPLSGLSWKPYRDGIFRVEVPQDEIAHLESFDRLFAGGKLQPLARYPDYDEQVQHFNGTAADAISPERVARWSDPAGGYLFAMHRSMWGDMSFRITGKDDRGGLAMEGGWQNNRPTPPHDALRYVENVLEELDAPGEWFDDEKTGTLYYYPPQGADLLATDFVAAGLRHLIEVRGSQDEPVTDVHFRNVTFSHTRRTFMDTREPLLRSDWCIDRGAALVFEGTERCGVGDCDLMDLGGNAVLFSNYNRHGEVTGCVIREVGASGVCFVGDPRAVRSPAFNCRQVYHLDELDRTPGPKTENYPADCRVHDCLITRTGRVEKQTAAVQISMSARIHVTHCSIYDVPRAGINVSEGTWGGHLIEFCDVFDTVKETGDHGSFNSWGRDRFWHVEGLDADRLGRDEFAEMPLWDARQTTVIRNSRWRCDQGWDIDLDDGSTNYDIHNNLCLRGGIKNREGFYRVVENNVMVDNTFHPHVWYRHSGDVFRRNIVFTPYRPIRVPKPWGKEIDRNLLVRPGQRQPQPATELQESSGRDAHSIVVDPLFVDAAKGDYRVRDGSPALELGFENFPMDRFGVKSARLRATARTPRLPGIGKQVLEGRLHESAVLTIMVESSSLTVDEPRVGSLSGPLDSTTSPMPPTPFFQQGVD
jgi:hypothetical protein